MNFPESIRVCSIPARFNHSSVQMTADRYGLELGQSARTGGGCHRAMALHIALAGLGSEFIVDAGAEQALVEFYANVGD